MNTFIYIEILAFRYLYWRHFPILSWLYYACCLFITNEKLLEELLDFIDPFKSYMSEFVTFSSFIIQCGTVESQYFLKSLFNSKIMDVYMSMYSMSVKTHLMSFRRLTTVSSAEQF